MMKFPRILLGIGIFSASLVGQSTDPATQQPGARLVLVPSEPLTEPRFPRPKMDKERPPASVAAPSGKPGVRPAILDLKPAADPIYLVEEPEPDAGQAQWRTYRRPKVDQFSRDSEGIAVRGYDVVSYLDERAENGKMEFSAEYGGAIWRFATAEHRDLFIRDPERYAPAFGGFCAYSIGKGYPATADPRVFTIDGGKLYLFLDKAVRAVWEQDRSRLVGKAHQNWPKLHR